jgi:murein DD-endopeptidase MepM/ murein hydrolase activator NlpD
MTWKVSNYNSLRSEFDTLRNRYQALQRDDDQKQEQLASLQMMASEVTMALGLKRKIEGTDDISDEGPLMPTYKESIENYNFLKSASFSRISHNYARAWQKNIVPSMWPLNGRILSRFGERQDPFSGEGAFHTGVDISAITGTPVHAAADGIVYTAEYDSGYGKMVVIDHGNGIRTRYAHLSAFEVVAGQEVRRGQVIALSGNTGHTTSAHLHFEVRMGGNAVNPYPYLMKSVMLQQVQPDLPF